MVKRRVSEGKAEKERVASWEQVCGLLLEREKVALGLSVGCAGQALVHGGLVCCYPQEPTMELAAKEAWLFRTPFGFLYPTPRSLQASLLAICCLPKPMKPVIISHVTSVRAEVANLEVPSALVSSPHCRGTLLTGRLLVFPGLC